MDDFVSELDFLWLYYISLAKSIDTLGVDLFYSYGV